jgi:hypothetical protein
MKYFDTTIKKILNEAGWKPQVGDITSDAGGTVKAALSPLLVKLSENLKKKSYINDTVQILQYKISNLKSITEDPDRENKLKAVFKLLNNRATVPSNNYQYRGSLPQQELATFIRDKVPLEHIDRLRIIIAPLDADETSYLSYFKFNNQQINELKQLFTQKTVTKQEADKEIRTVRTGADLAASFKAKNEKRYEQGQQQKAASQT